MAGAEADVLGMSQTGAVFGIGISVVEVVVMIVEVATFHFVGKLAAW